MKLLFILLFAALALACQSQMSCPIHPDSVAYFTGRTGFISGAFVGYYRCPRGHEFAAACK